MSWIRNKDVFSADKDITDKLINDMKKYADEATKGTKEQILPTITLHAEEKLKITFGEAILIRQQIWE